MIALKTWIFHRIEVVAFFQNAFILFAVAVPSPNLFRSSALLLNESDKIVPKQAAELFLGTSLPCPGPVGEKQTDETLWLAVMLMHITLHTLHILFKVYIYIYVHLSYIYIIKIISYDTMQYYFSHNHNMIICDAIQYDTENISLKK